MDYKNLVETKKGCILYSTTNPASMNIIDKLNKKYSWQIEENKIRFSLCSKKDCCSSFEGYGEDKDIIYIEPPKNANADYFLYASSHKSEQNLKSLTAHFPGNWSENIYGGKPYTLNYAFASKLKQILKILNEKNNEYKLNYNVAVEVNHHGPTINSKTPLIFVEIGSTKEEWTNPIAGEIVAFAIFRALLVRAEQYPTYIGFGGGHYAPKFTDYILGKRKLNKEEIAISHICPKYQIEKINQDVLRQAVEKNIEKISGAIIDKKGTTLDQREKIIDLLKKLELEYVMI